MLAFADASWDTPNPNWTLAHRAIGVDTGQAGIFDLRYFRQDGVVPTNYPGKRDKVRVEDRWYWMCCDVTRTPGTNAAVIPYGVVADSGWGDGYYPVYALRDDEDRVVGVRIVFIDMRTYEPDPE